MVELLQTDPPKTNALGIQSWSHPQPQRRVKAGGHPPPAWSSWLNDVRPLQSCNGYSSTAFTLRREADKDCVTTGAATFHQHLCWWPRSHHLHWRIDLALVVPHHNPKAAGQWVLFPAAVASVEACDCSCNEPTNLVSDVLTLLPSQRAPSRASLWWWGRWCRRSPRWSRSWRRWSCWVDPRSTSKSSPRITLRHKRVGSKWFQVRFPYSRLKTTSPQLSDGSPEPHHLCSKILHLLSQIGHFKLKSPKVGGHARNLKVGRGGSWPPCWQPRCEATQLTKAQRKVTANSTRM